MAIRFTPMTAGIPKNQRGSVEDVITILPSEEQVIVKKLRSLILECLPSATEKNTYGAPFYTHHKLICYIWPPSLYWAGKNRTLGERGVALGFCQGNLMSNEDNLLLAEGRKQTHCIYFKSIKEIREDQIRALLFEAELIDRSFIEKRRKRRSTTSHQIRTRRKP